MVDGAKFNSHDSVLQIVLVKICQHLLKYQQSKLFGQFDPMMGKTYLNIGG